MDKHPLDRQRRLALQLGLGLGLALALPASAQTSSAGKPRKAVNAARQTKSGTGPAYGHQPAVQAFAAQAAAHQGLDAAWVERHLAQARKQETVRRLIMPPPAGTAKNWAAYRARFIEPQRVAAGLAFWRTNQRWLDLAEARWGVPPGIVAAIVGVETFYGRMMGSFRVIDALATLSFDFPPGRKDRSEFFRSELAAFFVMCQREGSDPLAIQGSFAGAMGLPQFMPSSVNRFALDFDEDGHIDLHRNAADVVGSVAHFLAQAGWQRDLPTHHAVRVPVDTSARATLLAPDIVPSFTAAQFADHGAVLDDAGRKHEGPLALIELQNGGLAPSYVAGTRNFYVVTRYNWSSYYAMAVIELAQALQAAVERG